MSGGGFDLLPSARSTSSSGEFKRRWLLVRFIACDGSGDQDDSSGNERNLLSLHHGGRVLKGEKVVMQIMLEYNGDEDVQTWLEVVA